MKLFWCTAYLTIDAAMALRGSSRQDPTVICRMTMQDMLFEDGSSQQETACIPIVDNQETDFVIQLKLPDEMEVANQHELQQGSLWVTISDAEILEESILTTNDSEIAIVEEPAVRRNLQATTQRQLAARTEGDQSVAIVRIHTTDSSPSLTNRAVRDLFDTNQVNFITQFYKCSFGRLRFRKAKRNHLIDVYVDQPIAHFARSPDKLVYAAQEQIYERLHIYSMTQVAHKVVMVLPPGTGSWIAYAGVRHWRSQFNDSWSTSLTAMMHELGHNLGLRHANHQGQEYEDSTGIMSKSSRRSDGPQRCFNAYNNHVLGWYDEFRLDLESLTRTTRRISLAAFVHYDRVQRTGDPVLINVADDLYLQYNRAVLFNSGTGEMEDQVTITEQRDNDKEGSELLAGLTVGQVYRRPNFAGSVHTLVIRACKALNGGDDHSPDAMVISVGMNHASCGEANEPTPTPTVAPTRAPTSAPVPSPPTPPQSKGSLYDQLTRLLMWMLAFMGWGDN